MADGGIGTGKGLGIGWEAYLRLAEKRPWLFREGADLEIVMDEDEVARFREASGRAIGICYASPFNMMVCDLVRDRNGSEFAYERVVPTSTGTPVVAVPVVHGRYALLRQFRHALRREQLCFPRGFGEDGLSASENACKELGEELGAEVERVEDVGTVVADSGLSGAEVRVALCRLSSCEAAEGHEGIAEAELMSADELESAIASGRIDDGFTLSAWAMLCAKGLV